MSEGSATWVGALLLVAGCGSSAGVGPQVAPIPVETRLASHGYPKLFNALQFGWRPESWTLEQYDRAHLWDYIQVEPSLLEQPELAPYFGPTGLLRARNPNLVVSVYFVAAEAPPEVGQYYEGIREFARGIKPEWLLRDTQGRPLKGWSFGDGSFSHDIDLSAPGFAEYVVEYLNRVYPIGEQIDIIYQDLGAQTNWSAASYKFDNGRVDLDGDGVDEPDAVVDATLTNGMRRLHELSRARFPAGTPLVANCGSNCGLDYLDVLNGIVVEGFNYVPPGYENNFSFSWTAQMRTYGRYASESVAPRMSAPLVAFDRDATNFSRMRFTLASALMFDGYYSFTGKNPDNTATEGTWWYDEYAVDVSTGRAAGETLAKKGWLGEPIGPAYNAGNHDESLLDVLYRDETSAEARIWRRDFASGIVLVNPTTEARTLDLGATYRKILGTIDPEFNDGSMLSSITLPPKSGALLLR